MYLRLPLIHRSRHPLLRALSLLLGLAMLGVLVVFGLAVAGVLMVGGALWLVWRQWRRARAPQATPRATPTDVLEGEFVVIREGQHAAH